MGNRISLVVFFFLCTVGMLARQVTDTLESPKKDIAIITYDITQNNGQVVIKFIDVRKKLGSVYKDKYKKLNEVVVLFFDKVGNYEDKIEFSGLNVEAFMRPSNVKYNDSKDGYFLLNDNPIISLELKSAESTELSIPIFLAHYERKRHYKIFSKCGNLIVKLSPKKSDNGLTGVISKLVTQTVTSQEELESMFTDVDEANILIKKITDLLDEQEEYPFSDDLKQTIASLRDRSYRISDTKISARINEVLLACKSKEEELKGNAKAAAIAAEKESELKARRAEEQALARQDSIAAAAQLQAEKEKKQNLWLIIGGVILAILVFIGNQVFQHFRNVKNQKSIMDMQQSVVKRAEDEAKRRARNMAQSQINRVQGEARRKTRNAINNGVKKNNKGKGNKGISI